MRPATILRNPAVRLGLLLAGAGFVGVLSTLLMPLPVPPGTVLPMPMWMLKLLSLIQPTVLLLVAVWGGVRLASRVDLHAPVCEAVCTGTSIRSALRPQGVPGLVGAIASGVGLVAAGLVTPTALAEVQRLFDPPLATRLLYGGITEEVLVRWGLMTFLLWAGWRLFGSEAQPPGSVLAWGAIALAALLFGVGHLPVAFTLAEEVTGGVIAYIVGANSAFGVLFGYLFWRYGLEAAIIAHGGAHLVAYLLSQTPWLA